MHRIFRGKGKNLYNLEDIYFHMSKKKKKDSTLISIAIFLTLVLLVYSYIVFIPFYKTQKVFFIIYFFISPFILTLYFRYDTRFVRKIDCNMNIKTDDAEKIIILKQKPDDYFSRVPYLLSEKFNLSAISIIVANYLTPVILLFFLNIAYLGLRGELSFKNFHGPEGILFFSFFPLFFYAFMGIYEDLNDKKLLFHALKYFVFCCTFVFLISSIPMMLFGLKAEIENFSWLDIKDFFLPNLYLKGKYLSLAGICFTLTGVLFAVSTYLKYSSELSTQLQDKLKKYTKSLNNKYRVYCKTKKRNFSKFLLQYLNKKDNTKKDGTTQIEDIIKIQNILIFKDLSKRAFLIFALFGYFFVLFSFYSPTSEKGELLLTQGGLSLDIIVFLLFLFYTAFSIVNIYNSLK